MKTHSLRKIILFILLITSSLALCTFNQSTFSSIIYQELHVQINSTPIPDDLQQACTVHHHDFSASYYAECITINNTSNADLTISDGNQPWFNLPKKSWVVFYADVIVNMDLKVKNPDDNVLFSVYQSDTFWKANQQCGQEECKDQYN